MQDPPGLELPVGLIKVAAETPQPCLTHLSRELPRAIPGKAPAQQSQPLPACFPGDRTSVGTPRGWLGF